MKKTLTLALLMTCAMTFVGCVSIHTNNGATDNMPVANVQPSKYQAVTKVGDKQVKAQVTGHKLLGIFKWGMPSTFADNGNFGNSGLLGGAGIPLPFLGGNEYDKFKQAAVYIACTENNCDSLIDARYIITTKDYFIYEKVICEVIGTPVSITGYKLIE